MLTDPETTFLNSKEFAAAVDGAREGMATHGYEADDDTLKSVALSVLLKWTIAGGVSEHAMLELAAMIASVNERIQIPQH